MITKAEIQNLLKDIPYMESHTCLCLVYGAAIIESEEKFFILPFIYSSKRKSLSKTEEEKISQGLKLSNKIWHISDYWSDLIEDKKILHKVELLQNNNRIISRYFLLRYFDKDCQTNESNTVKMLIDNLYYYTAMRYHDLWKIIQFGFNIINKNLSKKFKTKDELFLEMVSLERNAFIESIIEQNSIILERTKIQKLLEFDLLQNPTKEDFEKLKDIIPKPVEKKLIENTLAKEVLNLVEKYKKYKRYNKLAFWYNRYLISEQFLSEALKALWEGKDSQGNQILRNLNW